MQGPAESDDMEDSPTWLHRPQSPSACRDDLCCDNPDVLLLEDDNAAPVLSDSGAQAAPWCAAVLCRKQ
jgi:hypothetical protein